MTMIISTTTMTTMIGIHLVQLTVQHTRDRLVALNPHKALHLPVQPRPVVAHHLVAANRLPPGAEDHPPAPLHPVHRGLLPQEVPRAHPVKLNPEHDRVHLPPKKQVPLPLPPCAKPVVRRPPPQPPKSGPFERPARPREVQPHKRVPRPVKHVEQRPPPRPPAGVRRVHLSMIYSGPMKRPISMQPSSLQRSD